VKHAEENRLSINVIFCDAGADRQRSSLKMSMTQAKGIARSFSYSGGASSSSNRF
jgi:hypothetical protein